MKLVSLDLHVVVVADPNTLHVRYNVGDGIDRGPIVLNEAESLEAFELWERGLALLRASEARQAQQASPSEAELGLAVGDASASEYTPLQTDPFALRPRRDEER